MKTKEASVKIHWVPIDEVKANPNNPRTISESKMQELCASIRAFPQMAGYRFLIVDRHTCFLLGGNQRHTAMKREGWKEVPVAYSDEMSAEQKKEFIIRDNIEAGFWDTDKLDFSFRDFPLVDWGIMEGTPAAAAREQDNSSVAADKIVYDNAEMKQIVVYFDSETHNKISAMLDLIREENYFGDNAEVLLFLIEEYGK